MYFPNNCCGRLTLKTGTIIIGIVDLALGLVGFLFHNIHKAGLFKDEPEPFFMKHILIPCLSRGVDSHGIFNWFHLQPLGASLVFLVASCLLIEGTRKNIYKFILPWLIITAVILLNIFVSIMTWDISDNLLSEEGLILWYINVVASAFASYMWIIVFSHYKQLARTPSQEYVEMQEKVAV